MRVSLLVALVVTAEGLLVAGFTSPTRAPDLLPPPVHASKQIASPRLGFGGLARWLFSSGDPAPPARSVISRSPYKYGGSVRHHPPVKHFAPSHPHGGLSYSQPKYAPPAPPPQLKCNPCNKVPWIPVPYGHTGADGANVFAVVSAPQLHQGLHASELPQTQLTSLDQGYLPPSGADTKTLNHNQNGDQYFAPSVGDVSGTVHVPEIVQSIPIANFVTSTIEHPINVQQSPIIDIGTGGYGGDQISSAPQDVRDPKLTLVHGQQHETHHSTGFGASQVPTAVVKAPHVPLLINAGVGGGDTQSASGPSAHDSTAITGGGDSTGVNGATAIGAPTGNGAFTGSGGATSYQHVNLHSENPVPVYAAQQQQHVSGPGQVVITPSVQTASELGLQQHIHGGAIHTQQQVPLENPPVPFQIPTFQQPPAVNSASVFHTNGNLFPNAGPPPLSANHIPPPALVPPPPKHAFFKGPPALVPSTSLNLPPPRGHLGSVQILRQIPPSATGLSPPPRPPHQLHHHGGTTASHPYRFELTPPAHGQPIYTDSNAPQSVDLSPGWINGPSTLPPTSSGSSFEVIHTHPGNTQQHENAFTSAADNSANKRPKQIQIIVPYTVSSQSNQLLEADASGLRSQWHHREINHQIQETRHVNVTSVPREPVHILAADLRAVLREEQERQDPNPNLIRLQNNIDEWTAQEFSNADANSNSVHPEDSRQHKATTAIGTLLPSKKIPTDFFPTSPTYASSTTRPRVLDHLGSGSVSHSVHAKIIGNKVALSINEVKTAAKPHVPDIELDGPETTQLPETTAEPKRTTWEQALLGFSPISNEKVYVVTPLSTHQWFYEVTTPHYLPTTQRPETSTTEKTAKGFFLKGRATKYQTTASPGVRSTIDTNSFRSPRFTVRPTPGHRLLISRPVTPPSRGNLFYTPEESDSYDTIPPKTDIPDDVVEKRSSVSANFETPTTQSPQETADVPDTQVGIVVSQPRPSKVVTVVSSSSSSQAVIKKATRLTSKSKPRVAPFEVPEPAEMEEVAAVVKEVSALELKRKGSSSS